MRLQFKHLSMAAASAMLIGCGGGGGSSAPASGNSGTTPSSNTGSTSGGTSTGNSGGSNNTGNTGGTTTSGGSNTGSTSGGSNGGNNNTGNTGGTSGTTASKVSIKGTVTYDLVPAKSDHRGLDYNNITKEKAKLVVVEAIDANNNILKTTRTDENGTYTLSDLPASTNVKIRVLAKMYKTGTPGWDVKVVDNTNSDAMYVMDGTLASTGTTNSTRDLNAPSGWTGNDYTQTRVAAPFAMLDTIESAMEKVKNAEEQAVFPPLVVNWSPDNVPSGGNPANGQIGTSHYQDGTLSILGDKDTDTDEYDNHVIAHEWGHYYEDKFSRSNSIGGSHTTGDILDIRVAFSEGWGNAFSAIALDDPIYFDTSGSKQSTGWSMDMESTSTTNSGWYSEESIQHIIYDLYDSHDDGSDTLSLGFTPIHQVMTHAEKNAPAFTSIFTFIKAMKDANSADANEIKNIVSSENIAEITDIWGAGRTNKASEVPYKELTVGTTVSNVQFDYSNGDNRNNLGNHYYYKFNVATAGDYTIKIHQNNGTDSDPDFYLYSTPPSNSSLPAIGETTAQGDETDSNVHLNAGDYLLDVRDYNNKSSAQFDISVN